jgi:hypothetical protein
VTGPNKYFNKKDVETFNNDHYELSKKCFEAPECSDERANGQSAGAPAALARM